MTFFERRVNEILKEQGLADEVLVDFARSAEGQSSFFSLLCLLGVMAIVEFILGFPSYMSYLIWGVWYLLSMKPFLFIITSQRVIVAYLYPVSFKNRLVHSYLLGEVEYLGSKKGLEGYTRHFRFSGGEKKSLFFSRWVKSIPEEVFEKTLRRAHSVLVDK